MLELPVLFILLLPLLGFLIGTAASMTGVGGGIFIVPLLTLVYAFTPSHAVGTSLTTILLTAIAATISYALQRRIRYKTGLLLAATTVPGAVLGAYATVVLPGDILALIFGVFLIIIAVQMTGLRDICRGLKNLENTKQVKLEKDDAESVDRLERELFKFKTKLTIGVSLGFLAGVSSGLLGVGGGLLLVPAITLVIGFPIHFAVATSMFTMILTSLSGVFQHYTIGNINPEYALLLGAGAVLGAQLGTYLNRKVSGKNLRRIFAVFLIVVGVQMILEFF